MAAPQTTVWELEPHTRAKHAILKRYLQAWTPTLSLGGFPQIAYIDGFAGPGKYSKGEDGSPVIALSFVTTKRTADGGIDGRLYFELPSERTLNSMAIEVKGGKNVSIRDLRALRGVLDNDEADMAGLIVMDPLGSTQQRNFKQFMAQAGDFTVNSIHYPRMQMISVPEILEGRRFQTPGVAGREEKAPVLPGTLPLFS